MGLENFLHGTITEQDTYAYTLCDILQYRAEKTPDKLAYIFLLDGDENEEKITFKELYKQAVVIADTIAKNGAKAKERAILLFPPGLEFVKTLYACFYAGLYAVPAYPPRKNRSLNRIISIVKDCDPTVCLTISGIREAYEKNFKDVEELKSLRWISTDQVSENRTNIHYKIVPEDLALLQYTSGSTASPKGVMVTHRNFMRNLEFLRQCFELTAETKTAHWLPVFHDMGLVIGILQPIYSGFTGIFMPPVSFIQQPIRWLRAFSRYGAVMGSAPNFAYDLCVSKISDEECAQLNLSTVKSLLNAAEPLRRATMESFTKKFNSYGFHLENFYPAYGLAEATLIVTGVKVEEKPQYIFVDKGALERNMIRITAEGDKNSLCQVSVGKTWIDTKVIIVDPELLIRCNEGYIGEIWISGSIVTEGYWNRSRETMETFKAFTKDTKEGPFLRTGDLGFCFEDNLYITGRIKDIIILRGRNFYPQDIEFVVENSHHALRSNHSAAFYVDVSNEEKLVVVAEVERTFIRDLDVEDICTAIRQAVYEEFEIEIFEIQLLRTASILKTSSGKIQRSACKKAYLNNELLVVGSSSLVQDTKDNRRESISADSVLKWLTAWISFKFKIDFSRIDINKSIVSYGLNSMKAVELQQHFLDTYGIDFPPYLFFEKISVKELAEKAYRLVKEAE